MPLLESIGFTGAGTELMYNGKTGEQIESDIFIGPTFYYRLKHLVEDKVHCLTESHDVLCKDGWKAITNITKEDGSSLQGGETKYKIYLDITDPSRINLANRFEMRPDDIVFVAAQPLSLYSRTLSQILGSTGLTLQARDTIRGELGN